MENSFDKKVPTSILWVAIALVVLSVIIYFIVLNYLELGWAELSAFGDMFGALSSLFSGLAFAVIIYTIYLQKSEFGLQREELILQRSELKRTAQSQEQLSRFRALNEILIIYEGKYKRESTQSRKDDYQQRIRRTEDLILELSESIISQDKSGEP